MKLTPAQQQTVLSNATAMMEMGCEPTSAIKQAASDAGVPYGAEMGEVVTWAIVVLCGESA